jgi:ABC-type polysaccharide/polyol phosphate export permease
VLEPILTLFAAPPRFNAVELVLNTVVAPVLDVVTSAPETLMFFAMVNAGLHCGALPVLVITVSATPIAKVFNVVAPLAYNMSPIVYVTSAVPPLFTGTALVKLLGFKN